MATPRLRQDLSVSIFTDAEGVSYFDVRDPRTGGVLRLFDFEWQVAERLDGRRSLDEVSRWTEAELGFQATAADLEVYVQRLLELGLFDSAMAQAGLPMPAVQQPPVQPTARQSDAAPEAVPSELEGAFSTAAWPAGPTTSASRQGGALGPTGTLTEIDVAPAVARAAEAQAATTAARSDAAEGARPAPAQAVAPAATPATTPAMTPATTPATTKDHPLETRATLLLDTLKPPAVADMPTLLAAPPDAGRPTLPLAPIEAGSESAGPAVQGDKIETAPVQEPVAKVTLPAAAALPIVPAESSAADSGEPAQAAGPLPIDTTQTPSDEKTAPLGEQATRPDSGSQAGELRAATKPVAPVIRNADLDEVEEPGRAGRWVAIAIVLLVLAVAIYFLIGLLNPAIGVQVMRAQPHQVIRKLAAPALVRAGQKATLRMEGGGLLASVVSVGSEVSAGMSLAALQNQGKLQRDITELRERLAFYQHRLEVARDKEDAAGQREAQAKVNEKQERLAVAEAGLKKSQILATRAGVITKVMVNAGEMVTPGSEILEIADRYQGAEMKLGAADSSGLKLGQTVALQGTTVPINAKVASLTPQGAEVVVLFELPDDAAVKPGDELHMIKGQLNDVVELPDSAITDGDTVYVMNQGKAARRKVSVVDHDGHNALVAGLTIGDQVIVSNLGGLREGKSVKPIAPQGPTGAL